MLSSSSSSSSSRTPTNYPKAMPSPLPLLPT
jgi:hypothetical protein